MDAPVPSDISVPAFDPCYLPWEGGWEPPPVAPEGDDAIDPEYGEYTDVGAHEWRA